MNNLDWKDLIAEDHQGAAWRIRALGIMAIIAIAFFVILRVAKNLFLGCAWCWVPQGFSPALLKWFGGTPV